MEIIGPNEDYVEIVKKIIEQNNKIIETNRIIVETFSLPRFYVDKEFDSDVK